MGDDIMIKRFRNTIRKITAFVMAFIMTFTMVSAYEAVKAYAEADFQMTLESFPLSYRPYLTALHELHPNWKFEAVNTGLDWNEVLKNEMVLSRNLVPFYSSTTGGTLSKMTLKGVDVSPDGGEYWYYTPTSWKATEITGSYNWSNDAWVRFDSGWAQASTSAVEYIMDPRNWINETSIFMFEQLGYNSENHTKSILVSMMEDTFMDCDYARVPGSNGRSYADVLLEAAQTYNVNPISLCTRLFQEKGRGTYNSASGTYELTDTLGCGVSSSDGGNTFHAKQDGETAYYNFFNIGASGTGRDEIINNAGKEAVKEGWTTPYLAIMGGAKKFVSGYIAIGQDTLYFQKFSVVNEKYLYWKQYMQNLLAPVNEGYTVMNAYKSAGMLDLSHTFRIPVYENMPETACSRPQPVYDTTNPNYKLSGITVKGTDLFGNTSDLAITPTFNMDTDTYSIVIPYAVNKITVNATSISNKAAISGTGTYDVAVGNNTYLIKCTSEFGTSKTYTLNVTRSAGSTLFKSLATSSGGFTGNFDKLTTSYDQYVSNDVEKIKLDYATETDYAKVVLTNTDIVYELPMKEETGTEETTAEKTTEEATAETSQETAGETTAESAAESFETSESGINHRVYEEYVIRKDDNPEIYLHEGKNVITINVYPSENDTSTKTTYTVCIYRYTKTEYSLNSITVKDNNVQNFEIGDTVKSAAAKMTITNGRYVFTDKNGNIKAQDAVIATGDILKICDANDNCMHSYNIVIYGDINGDGKVDLLDFVLIKNKILGIKELQGVYLMAADTNPKSQGIDLFDFVSIKNYIINGTPVNQTR